MTTIKTIGSIFIILLVILAAIANIKKKKEPKLEAKNDGKDKKPIKENLMNENQEIKTSLSNKVKKPKRIFKEEEFSDWSKYDGSNKKYD